MVSPGINGNFDHIDGFISWIGSGNRFPGLNVGMIADSDMENYPEIANAKLLIIPGHTEYWTRRARENFDRFVNNGGNALILSGNNMWWQVRLQNDPNNTSNPQMVCNKYPYMNVPSDTYPDPLKKTICWADTNLLYSIIGSIGADFVPAGFSGTRVSATSTPPCAPTNMVYAGFEGKMLTIPNSPIFAGTNQSFHDIMNDYIAGPAICGKKGTGDAELDCTVTLRNEQKQEVFDGNGDPILDKRALGFYRGEMVGYDIASYLPSPYERIFNNASQMIFPPYYSGILALQRTCSSGTIINVCNNDWCHRDVMSIPTMQTVTQNMINLLTDPTTYGSAFTTPVPAEFVLTHAWPRNVSYRACQCGEIRITPCGVELTNGYRVDQYGGEFAAKIINCSNCGPSEGECVDCSPDSGPDGHGRAAGGDALALQKAVAENEAHLEVFPMPNSGQFTVKLTGEGNYIKHVSVFNSQAQQLFNRDFSDGKSTLDLQLSELKNGVYTVEVSGFTGTYRSKVIISN